MTKGTIKWFDANKGYGFIERAKEDDLFVHISQWRGPLGTVPVAGARVTFEVGIDPEGEPEARNVYPVSPGEGKQ
jgi:CspA family cold shock protein